MCASPPRLRGEGWGEGLFRLRALAMEASPLTRHPRICADPDLSPQAGRGDLRWIDAYAYTSCQ